ncbi:hypothetical protein C8Q76DRAFT_762202 [Earliella scabrosa]|nr:hypothetical protein C8Q76DRAFT_762202 [Earliella scabrosa]
MGKLNIAHHKSYHPYRRDNIERVRRDEEEARLKEAAEEGRMLLADSEARMELLRERAGLTGVKRGKRRNDDDDLERAIQERDEKERDSERAADAVPAMLTSASGHINLFEDLERNTLAMVPVRSTKKGARQPPVESEKGVALAPSAKDLNPWYSEKDPEGSRETDEDKRIRDIARKSVHDPLTSINSQLAPRPAPSTRSSRAPLRGTQSGRTSSSNSLPNRRASSNPSAERETRESAERLRALELIRRKKRETEGSETPGTVHGGSGGGGYGYEDVFNRREVEELHRARRRGGERERDLDRAGDGGRNGYDFRSASRRRW